MNKAVIFASALLLAGAASAPPGQSQVPQQYRPPCRIPKHELVVIAFGNGMATYDLDTKQPVCIVQLPDGPPTQIATSGDGRIFAAIRASGWDRYSTDPGHVDVIGPDGRLLHRFGQGIVGPWDIAVERSGRHFFLYSDGDMILNGAEGGGWSPKLGMYDANTGKLLRTYPLDPDQSTYSYFTVSPDGRTIDVAYSGKNARMETLDAASGRLLRTGPVPKSKPPLVLDGVLYSDDLSVDAAPPGSQIPIDATTMISRTVTATDQKLKPIGIRTLVNDYDVTDPTPKLASATPGPDAREPVFSSAAQIRRSIPHTASGVQFDDSVTGKHYSYLGDYARADDPQGHEITIVDCSRGLALIADTQKRTYVVRRMNPTKLTDRPPQRPEPKRTPPPWPKGAPTPDPRMKPEIAYAVTPLTRAQLHSPLAASGFTTTFDFYPMGRQIGGQTMGNELEYADMPAPYPACVNHPFGGEALGITPQSLAGSTDILASLDARILPYVHRAGSIPQDVSQKLLVHMETAENGPIKAVFDVRNLRAFSVKDGSLFAPPPGYVQDLAPEY